jgi:hypothetical protein
VAVLVMLSIILTSSVLFPSIGSSTIIAILATGTGIAVATGVAMLVYRRWHPGLASAPALDRGLRPTWRMPPLTLLTRPALSTGRRVGLTVLRTYLLIAMILVIVRVVQLALGT